ncbi:MAG: hypothetical protein IT537_26115 [Hyphomicrobiales bacterium]|nr:hypothetical protein [Hyphomicrobiales bacterium]
MHASTGLKHASCAALVAFVTALACAPGASAADACASYGDERTDFTWLLCPDGKKYERQYRYFGVWSDFYPVPGNAGACTWSGARSAWICPDATIVCNGLRCRNARRHPAGGTRNLPLQPAARIFSSTGRI